jgi:hypothetical protein
MSERTNTSGVESPAPASSLTEDETLGRLLSGRAEPSILERERGFDAVMRRVNANASGAERARLALARIKQQPRATLVAFTMVFVPLAAAASWALWVTPHSLADNDAGSQMTSPGNFATWWEHSPVAETPSASSSAIIGGDVNPAALASIVEEMDAGVSSKVAAGKATRSVVNPTSSASNPTLPPKGKGKKPKSRLPSKSGL